MKTNLILSILLFSLSTSCFADGMEHPISGRTISTERSSTEKRVPGEQVDARLPPVIPGQQVQAGGKTHKVISTAGAVPVGAPPQPPQAAVAPSNNSQNSLGSISVIVDDRKRR
ncbi:MAG: hypothetical protein KDD70_16315 [Bdellovibrionales bacterium]|nr:hypothetical protein [Bdellovibrionales bacterium]